MAKLKALKPMLATLPSRLARPSYDAVSRTQARDQSNKWRSWYKTARWQKLRQKILKRDGWRCQQTNRLVIGKYPSGNSAVVDHIKPHRGNPDLFWDESNLQTVSKEYHDSEKQKLERSGVIG